MACLLLMPVSMHVNVIATRPKGGLLTAQRARPVRARGRVTRVPLTDALTFGPQSWEQVLARAESP